MAKDLAGTSKKSSKDRKETAAVEIAGQPADTTPTLQKSSQARTKQAVIIVHGMGEQKPLETLRGFVDVVWKTKRTKGASNFVGGEPSPDDTWIVPDLRVGLKELARITTRRGEVTTENGEKRRVAVDFYELYWADLLVGNTLTQIRAWISGLLLRWPHQVPRESFGLWIALWAIVALIVGLVAKVGVDLDGAWDKLTELFEKPTEISGTFCAYFVANVPLPTWLGWSTVLSGLVTAILWLGLGLKLRDHLRDWQHPDGKFFGIWASQTPRQASVFVFVSVLLVIVVPVVMGWLVHSYFPTAVICATNTWLLLVAAILATVLTGWVVPVFGDVARYVRTSPDAVSARADIRDRGVELLRALHGPKQDDPTPRYDFGNEGGYERIVVVGHSLGSIVAYDILRLFWEERGPTRLNPAGEAAQAALGELDQFCRDNLQAPAELDVDEFQKLQKKVAQALSNDSDGWRVSDFITLGSPLSHAEFLVSQDRAGFEERKFERLFPTCPPMMEPPAPKASFLYSSESVASELGLDSETKFAHHGAMFAAMRWTNIYDPSWALFFGDFISGPCRPNFGPGIRDIPIAIRRPGLFRYLIGSLVTHTNYWDPQANAYALDKDGKKIEDDDRAHLTKLKEALALPTPKREQRR